MLTKKQIGEIKEHLERAQRPLFFYDNDSDGLCSFVLLRKFLDRGKGVAIRSFPNLDKNYVRKVEELNPDYVFVLDKPYVSDDFFAAIREIGLPVVWIDHHDIEKVDETAQKFDNLYLYNWARNKGEDKSDEPVTYWAYKISNRKEDLWIAVCGCIADSYLPDFISDFKERWPEFWTEKEVKTAFDAYFGTEIGRIAESLNFGLKDSTSNIVKLQNFLISINEPGEVFEETSKNYDFRKKYKEIKKKYDSLVERAKTRVGKKMLSFDYSGDLSISSEISNRLLYSFPGKIIFVAFRKGAISNISLRGKGVKKFLERILSSGEFENATGGGHEDAVGARIKTEDLDKFKKFLEEEIDKK